MTTRNRDWRRLAIIALFFAIACTAHAQDALLQICLGAAADYSPMFATSIIPASAQEVTAVFRFPNGEVHKQIVGTWTAVDVGAAAPPNYVVMKSAAKDRTAKGRLWLSLPRPLPVGRYRLDLSADGKPWKSAEFSVVADSAPAQMIRADSLLGARQAWTYDFMQEAASGARISMPGVTPDAQGRLRATVVLNVAGNDGYGRHVEMRRNGQLVFEEWWRIDTNGWSATKRKSPDETIVLDPPQVLMPVPTANSSKWTYAPRDGSYQQTYKMFGPVNLDTPAGEKPGYVVLVEQAGGRVDISVERHFVPGIGMTRETIVTALDHDMVSRQEMILKP